MKTPTPMGFIQRVRIEWLEQAAELALAGKSREEIRSILHETLVAPEGKGESEGEGGGRAGIGKNLQMAIGIVLNVWVAVPPDLRGLRDDGLRYIAALPTDEHLSVHWGMAMAVYPFFGKVAETTGRLARLQGTVSAPQVQRRISEQLGDHESVKRSTRRVLRSFVDWGVLADTETAGVYAASSPRTLSESLSAWMLEAAIISKRTNAGQIQAVVGSPALFPFALDVPSIKAVEASGRLEVSRQGLDQDMVMLRSVPAAVNA